MIQKIDLFFKLSKQLLLQFPSSYSETVVAFERLNGALARGSATSSLRQIDDSLPVSWEFSGFSQNGEDGIIDYLTRKIRNPNFYFVEIGSADGIENNSAWLALARKFNGLLIEGDIDTSKKAERFISKLNGGIQFVCHFITTKNVKSVVENHSLYNNPDFFSLDIDGNDYHVARVLLEEKIRPKVFAVEYNSAFGPEASLTVTYQENIDFLKVHESCLYYGASIGAWKKLFKKHGYEFITVDRNGVNAFFVDTKEFDPQFLSNIRGFDFRENFCQLKKFKVSWKEQFKKIQHLAFEDV